MKNHKIANINNKFVLIVFMLFFIISNVFSQLKDKPDWTSPNRKFNFYDIQADFNKYWSGKKITTETPKSERLGWKQFKRWEWFWEQRVFPSGEFPPRGFVYEEYLKQKKKRKKKSNEKIQANDTWEFVGPTGASGGYTGMGRINCIIEDPNYNGSSNRTLWVGAASGGIWKSTNGGSSWATNTDDLSVLGIGDIVINPNNSNIMYVATGDGDSYDTYSVGVLKSTDGGNSWHTTGFQLQVTNFFVSRRMIINPDNPNVLFVATNGGLYRTTNAGTNWSQVVSGNFYDVKMKPGDTSIVYAATRNQFYRSTNGGSSFTEITSGIPSGSSRFAIAVAESNSNYVYLLSSLSNGGFNGVYRSTNSGQSFSTRSTTPNILNSSSDGTGTGGQGWYDLTIAVDPSDEAHVFVGGVDIWESTNGGQNWDLNTYWYDLGGVEVVHADHHMLYFPASNRFYTTNDGGVDISTNQGTNWTYIGSGLKITQFYRIAVSQTNSNLVLCGAQDNSTFLKTGSSFAMTISTGDGMDEAINPNNDNQMFTESYYGSIARSSNGGASWTRNLKPNDDGYWVTPFQLNPQNPSSLYAGYVNVWKTGNGGSNWTKMSDLPNTSSLRVLHIAYADSNYIYAGTLGNLWKTTNGGTNWSSVTLPSSVSLSRIESNPNNAQDIWIACSGYGSGKKVYHSTNGGGSWSNISGSLPNIPVNCIIYQEGYKNRLYIGTDIGVYYYDDDTHGDWVEFSTGLPNVIVNDLEIQSSSNTLYAGTYGRGLWKINIPESSGTTPLSKPNLVYPSNNSGSIPIDCTFKWNTVNNATAYELFVSLNSDFSTEFFRQSGLSDTTYTYSQLDYNTIYYWKVKASNSTDTSDWSDVRMFSTILEKPVLTSPDDNVFSVLLTDTLFWESVTGANYYHLEIAINSSFSPIYFQQSSIFTNSFIIPNALLENNTKYYWHIKAVKTNPQTESNWSDTRNFTTILASPELLAPKNDSLGVELTGNFTWNSVSGASSFNLQLSNNSNFTTTIIDTIELTSSTLPFDSLDYNNNYYWRAKAVNPQQSSLWSETWHFRTILQAPTLSEPLNNSSGIQIDAHLNWHPVDGADTYGIQVSSDTTMTDSVIYVTDISDTIYFCSGLDSKSKYFWRVFASNNDGRVSKWSNIWSFETVLGSPYIPSPNDSADGVAVNGILVWNNVNGANHYHVQLSSNKNFTEFNLNDSSITATSVSYFNLNPNTNYYWHVRALSSSNSGNWSKTWEFKTGLSGVILIYPADDSRGIPINGSLRWQAMSGADTYRVQLSKNQDFTTTIIDDSSITATSKAFSNLESNIRYYWRVNSKNNSGTSDWSKVWHFTTTAGEPELLYPDNNAGGLRRSDTLIWSSTAGANTYHLQIADDSAMKNIIHEENILNDTLYIYSGFDYFKTYYWRVQATNNDGASPWSEIRNYTTIVAPPDLSYPLDDSYDVLTSDKIKWFSVDGADKYTLLVSTKNTFDVNVVEEENINTNTYDFLDLEYNTTYYWKVRAGNDDAMGDWSDVWHFQTKLSSPRLDYPRDSSIQVPTEGQTRWYAVDGYKSYRIQIAKKEDFNSTIVDTSGLMFAQYDYGNLEEATTYFWRVNTSNDHSTSDWSSVWSFTTFNPNPVVENNTSGISFKAYPNPFSYNTLFEFTIKKSAKVSITIYNQLGQKIDKINLGYIKAGNYTQIWEPTNFTNGIYNAILSVGRYKINLRIIILK